MLDSSYSKRRINMMKNTIYEELERVFAMISEYVKREDIVSIAKLYFCFTVNYAFASSETLLIIRVLTKRRAISFPFTCLAKVWI